MKKTKKAKSVAKPSKKALPINQTKPAKTSALFNVRWFKEQIAKQGLSGRAIADLMGINQSVISHMYAGSRKMKLEEAVKWAEILKVPVQEIMLNAGVDAASVGSGSESIFSAPSEMVPVKGWVDADHKVHWEPAKGPTSAPNPLNAIQGAGVACLRFQTSGGAYDGALVYYRELPGDMFDYEGMGKLCLVKVDGEHLLRVPLRGYEPGRHNLTLFNGTPKEEGVVIEMATQVLWLKL